MSQFEPTVAVSPAKRAVPSAPPANDRIARAQLLERMPKVGDVLFGFRLRRELGRGAFACVFLATQHDLAGRPVVLKISNIEGDEPQTLAQLQHTHIVPIYSLHESDPHGLRAVCMPYFGGAALSRVLELLRKKHSRPTTGTQLALALEAAVESALAKNPHPESERQIDLALVDHAGPKPIDLLRSLDYPRACAWIVARLAEGLQHAHQKGVIHCDIKPSNVLIGGDGTPMLLDFNVSQSELIAPEDAIIGGTFAYMAPERHRAILGDQDLEVGSSQPTSSQKSIPSDARCDLYSLGVVLFEMLTGVLPKRGQLPSPRAIRADIPWTLESICRKCLDAEPTRRYENAGELVEDLRRFQADEPLRFAPELSVRERAIKWYRRHPHLRSSSAVAFVAALLLVPAVLATLVSRQHLQATQEALDLAQAEEHKRAYEQGTLRALCLVNTHSDLPSHLAEGLEICEKTLALFGALERDDWQQHHDWQRLDPESRIRLAEDTRELLILLAWARARQTPKDANVLKAGLKLLDRAEGIAELPPSRALWEDRARYLELLDDNSGAEEARTRAAAIPTTTARDHYLLATVHARRGQYGDAVALLNRAVLLNPRHYWALLQRGICHQELGQSALAAGDFGTCIGLWPEFAFGYFNRGAVLEKSGFQVQAIADYTAALACDPNFVLARLNRGMVHLELDEYESALDDFRRVRESGRDDASLNLGIGVALERLKRPEEADAAFERAFEKSPADPEPLQIRHLWVFAFAVADRAPDRSGAAFDRVLKKIPTHPQARYGKAVLLGNQKQEEAALALLHPIIQSSPSFLAPRRYRALLSARRGDFNAASRDVNWCLEQTHDRGPNLYAAACVAALAAGKARDPEQANKATSQALAFLKKSLEFSFAKVHFADDPDLAAIRQHPDFPPIRIAATR